MNEVIEGGARQSTRRVSRTALAGMALTLGLAAVAIGRSGSDDTPKASSEPTKKSVASTVQLGQGRSFQTSAGSPAGFVSYRFTLENRSTTPVEILRIGEDGTGLNLETVKPSAPWKMAPKGQTPVTLEFRVTECSDVSRKEWRIPVEVRSGGKTSVIKMRLNSAGPKSHWQIFMTETVCPG